MKPHLQEQFADVVTSYDLVELLALHLEDYVWEEFAFTSRSALVRRGANQMVKAMLGERRCEIQICCDGVLSLPRAQLTVSRIVRALAAVIQISNCRDFVVGIPRRRNRLGNKLSVRFQHPS